MSEPAMIHQFIFAAPKPGLSREGFASYWLNLHAPDLAAKIPQVRRYLVATPLDLDTGRDVPDFAGCAELWIRPDEQIASLQSPEFLQGARADEPRWASFWLTLAFDTDPVMIMGEPEPPSGSAYAKIYFLLKRSLDRSLPDFRQQLAGERRKLSRPKGLERHLIGFCREGLYGLGEPRFDAVEVLGFRERDSLAAALDSGLREELQTGWPFVHPAYRFGLACQEHWIIGPKAR